MAFAPKSVRLPRTSVILIFYNSSRFLAEAIESVFRQTDQDWELILVDDGSTDGSSEVAQACAEAQDRVRYVSHPGRVNRGISASRNLGTRHATGEFLTFLDSDDVWSNEKLAQQLAIFDEHPRIAAVLGALEYWFSWDATAHQNDHVVLTGHAADKLIDPPEALLSFYPLGTAPGAGVDIMIRRSVFLELGGFDDSFPGMYEDQILLCKLYLRHQIYVSSKPWLKYRQHPDSCSAASPFGSRSYHAHRMVFLRWLLAYVQSQPDKHPAVMKKLKAALWAQRLAQLRLTVALVPELARRGMRRLR